MFLIESCKHCTVCNTVTPHSRRWLSYPRLLAFALSACGVRMFFFALPGIIAGCILLFIALGVVLFDRDRMWGLECDRCRGKARLEIEKTKPDLEDTEINIL